MQKLDRIYKELSKEKNQVLTLRQSHTGFEIKLSFADYVKKNYPEYYSKVIDIIDQLGGRTEASGHSIDLDYNKNRFYSLINL